MKNRTRKRILLMGMLCALGLTVCACNGTKETPDAGEQQEEPEGSALGDGEPASEPEPAENTGSGQDASEDPTSDETGSTSAGWVDSPYDLEGSVKELKDGQFTLVEFLSEETDDGGMVLAAPSGEGDDSEFQKQLVTYDEHTLFAIQTIYDGGARSEISEATAEDLTAGQDVQIWGSSSGEGWKATQICIVKTE